MAVRPAAQPPAVNRPVVIVVGSAIHEIAPEELTSELIGLKALGLLRLPIPWVPPFYVVSSTKSSTPKAHVAAARRVGIGPDDEVLVRSSGTLEGMEERGSLETRPSLLRDVGKTIGRLKRLPAFRTEATRQTIHFVVQKRVASRKVGHLANERRLQRHPRDWRFEIEGGGISQSLGVRNWRNASTAGLTALECSASVLIAGALRSVASWALPHRAHIEWVWDGSVVWVVQLDYLNVRRRGVKPSDLVSHQPRPTVAASELKLFLPSNAEGLINYPKLRNARIYGKLGYVMPSFYVLRDESTVSDLLLRGAISDDLREDLSKLCAYPFVLRTDASGLAQDQRQMLPRSDELRSLTAATEWLQGPFSEAMSTLADASDVVLIGHHYIPAVASAWSLAAPNDRRVRIESLWGIPEGLYCFAYDVFDVDTLHAQLDGHDANCAKIISKREPYKGKFVAPNDDGEWIVQNTADGPDWSRSIRNDSWVKEIAWTSRRIAKEVGRKVVVMWFIGVPDSQQLQAVMPWYHEEWKPTPGGYKKAAPRTKRASAQIRKVASQRDWLQLREDIERGIQVERVVIDPTDSSIIRAREFVQDLAVHAKEHAYVIELSGGLLSHFFYMLTKEGCNVECVDLFGVAEEAIEFNKIVRDKIPDDIQERGESVDVIQLHGDALIEGLRRKLVEEALEVADALSVEDMTDELADVSEVLDALIRTLQISREEVRERQTKKRSNRGGFKDGLMLMRTSLPTTLRGPLEVESAPLIQRRLISDVNELPHHDVNFHVDQRIDASGSRERQLTMTLSAHDQRYSAGEHRFDLATPKGGRHDMFFNARIDRVGSTLRLKVRLTNAALQLSLPFEAETPMEES